MNNILVIRPRGGLSNRLRFLFSYIQILNNKNILHNIKLIVLWKYHIECPFYFTDCLKKPIPNLEFIKYDKDLKHKINDSSYNYANEYNISQNLLNNIVFSPKLNILLEIKNIINILENNYIAVHIRRTDHSKMAQNIGNYTDDNQFINFLNKHKNYNIFLATDCINIQKKFKKLYNKRIKYIKFIKSENMNGIRTTLFKDAIIDMFTCALSQKFKGSGFSSYSELIFQIRIHNKIDNNTKFSSLNVINKYIKS